MNKLRDNRSALFALFSIWFLLFGFWFSCTSTPEDPGFDNPLDPTEEEYTPPETSILQGPDEGEIVADHTVTFVFGGNELLTEYAYRQNGAAWSPWSSDASVTLQYLDEGEYLFEVKGCYISGDEDSSPASRSYTIDDIQGPALWFSPRKVQTSTGESFALHLKVEDAADLMVIHAQVQFPASRLSLDSYQVLDEAGDFLAGNSGRVVSLVDSALSQGEIGFNLAVMGASPPGLNGTGALIRLTFTPSQSGPAEIRLASGSGMITSDLEEITPTELVTGLVEVGP
ncbi:MAG: hypothetical protein V3W14_10160 [Candidatus Neomarinimicrobiota bacterium]